MITAAKLIVESLQVQLAERDTQIVAIDIPDEEKICKETGVPLQKIGEEVSHKLAHRPGSYFLKRIVRPKYAHPHQEERGVVTAPMPDSLLPKCKVGEPRP